MGLLYNWVFPHHATGLAWLTGMGENSHVNPLVHLRYGSNYTGNGKSPNLKRVKTVVAQRQHSCFWACTAQIPTEYVISALLVNVHQRYMTKTEKRTKLEELVCFGLYRFSLEQYSISPFCWSGSSGGWWSCKQIQSFPKSSCKTSS